MENERLNELLGEINKKFPNKFRSDILEVDNGVIILYVNGSIIVNSMLDYFTQFAKDNNLYFWVSNWDPISKLVIGLALL